MNTKTKNGAMLMAVFLLGACATTAAPQGELTSAKSAISAAEAKGAQDVPRASLYLKMARDGVDQAEALMEQDKYREAEAVLSRAQIDAELAVSLTREEQAKKEAEKQLERVKSLKQSLIARSGDAVPS